MKKEEYLRELNKVFNNFKFFESDHHYEYKGERVGISVTNLIEEYTNEFDAETIALLQSNPLKHIKYNGYIYSLTVHRSGVYRYTTTSDDANFAKYIDVNVENATWHCYNNPNDVLQNHIND